MTSYICNMGRSDLTDIYAQARGRAATKGECGHMYQANHNYACYICYVTLLANYAIHRQGWCFRLWHLEYNIVMMYIYTKQYNCFNCGIE